MHQLQFRKEELKVTASIKLILKTPVRKLLKSYANDSSGRATNAVNDIINKIGLTIESFQ